MLLSQFQIRKLTEYLLLSAYSVEKAGFYMGKAGIALTLFELSRFDGKLFDELHLEDHAINLLTESLTYEVEDCEFANGKTGIGFALNYLIINQFVDADYLEIYQKQHLDILQKIIKLEFKFANWYYYSDFLLYVHCLRKLTEGSDIFKYQTILISYNLSFLDSLSNNAKLENAPQIYECVTRLLSVLNTVDLPVEYAVKMIRKIREVDVHLTNLDCICDHPLFLAQFFCSTLLYQSDEIKTELRERLLHIMQNSIFDVWDIRLKINLVFVISRIAQLDNSYNYRSLIEPFMHPIADDTPRSFEGFIYRMIHSRNLIKTGEHTSIINKWIWLNIHYDKMTNGACNHDVIELFNC